VGVTYHSVLRVSTLTCLRPRYRIVIINLNRNKLM